MVHKSETTCILRALKPFIWNLKWIENVILLHDVDEHGAKEIATG
jgi:hypothetical protein